MLPERLVSPEQNRPNDSEVDIFLKTQRPAFDAKRFFAKTEGMENEDEYSEEDEDSKYELEGFEEDVDRAEKYLVFFRKDIGNILSEEDEKKMRQEINTKRIQLVNIAIEQGFYRNREGEQERHKEIKELEQSLEKQLRERSLILKAEETLIHAQERLEDQRNRIQSLSQERGGFSEKVNSISYDLQSLQNEQCLYEYRGRLKDIASSLGNTKMKLEEFSSSNTLEQANGHETDSNSSSSLSKTSESQSENLLSFSSQTERFEYFVEHFKEQMKAVTILIHQIETESNDPNATAEGVKDNLEKNQLYEVLSEDQRRNFAKQIDYFFERKKSVIDFLEQHEGKSSQELIGILSDIDPTKLEGSITHQLDGHILKFFVENGKDYERIYFKGKEGDSRSGGFMSTRIGVFITVAKGSRDISYLKSVNVHEDRHVRDHILGLYELDNKGFKSNAQAEVLAFMKDGDRDPQGILYVLTKDDTIYDYKMDISFKETDVQTLKKEISIIEENLATYNASKRRIGELEYKLNSLNESSRHRNNETIRNEVMDVFVKERYIHELRLRIANFTSGIEAINYYKDHYYYNSDNDSDNLETMIDIVLSQRSQLRDQLYELEESAQWALRHSEWDTEVNDQYSNLSKQLFEAKSELVKNALNEEECIVLKKELQEKKQKLQKGEQWLRHKRMVTDAIETLSQYEGHTVNLDLLAVMPIKKWHFALEQLMPTIVALPESASENIMIRAKKKKELEQQHLTHSVKNQPQQQKPNFFKHILSFFGY